MPLSLDQNLSDRMDELHRQPQISLESSSFQSAIPFVGNKFEISGSSSFRPDMISHSDGRLSAVYVDDTYHLYYLYTDADRTVWQRQNISFGGGLNYEVYASLVELANDNIGILYTRDDALRYVIVTSAGAVVTSHTVVEELSGSYTWGAPFVCKLNDGSYLMVQARTDGSTYEIVKRTSADFTSWSAASSITLTGIDNTFEISSPSLFHTADGDLFLLFEYVTASSGSDTIINLYSAISTDGGSTFTAPTARTNTTDYNTDNLRPIMVQKSDGTAYLIFYQKIGVLLIDDNSDSFYVDDEYVECTSYGMTPLDLHWDQANNKVIIPFGNPTASGSKRICGVAVIDPDSWSIDNLYTSVTTPALSGAVTDQNHWWARRMTHGDGKYIVFAADGVVGTDLDLVVLFDHTTETFTYYLIKDTARTGDYEEPDSLPSYNMDVNCKVDLGQREYGFQVLPLAGVRLDADAGRIYLMWAQGYSMFRISFGYIDITAAPDAEGMYVVTLMNDKDSGIPLWGGIKWYPLGHIDVVKGLASQWTGGFEYVKDHGYFVINATGGYSGLHYCPGAAVVYAVQDDEISLLTEYRTAVYEAAPYHGFQRSFYYDGHLYGSFEYYSGQADRRGLCQINLSTNIIKYFRPTFDTRDDYTFYDFAVSADGQRLVVAMSDGVATFDIESTAWEVFDSNNTFFATPGAGAFYTVAVDSVTGNIAAGGSSGTINGAVLFNENGVFYQLKYQLATKSDTWSFSDNEDLSYHMSEMEPAAAISEDDALWAVWARNKTSSGGGYELMWDMDLLSISLADDIVGKVTAEWKLKEFNRLNFVLARGHLYDPHNNMSILSRLVRKGRKITLKIGEKIDGSVYWADQGVYLVDGTSMEYSRSSGDHPIINVSCTSKCQIWFENEVVVSTDYKGIDPDFVLTDLLATYTQLDVDDYNIGELNSAHKIYVQWLDRTLVDMMEEVLDHFFYALYDGMDGVLTIKRVNVDRAVDRTYSDNKMMRTFAPNNRNSSYTNRVRVTGETRDYLEVVYAEELIKTISGTCGWWNLHDTFRVDYSEDGERKCIDPRLVVLQSVTEYGLLLDQMAIGSGGERISYEDPDNKYCIVEIDLPNLIPAFIGAVISMITIGASSLRCFYCGPFIAALAVAVSLVMYILGAIATYQYEIHAQPLGKVKQTIQYTANDTELQREIGGEVVESGIDDHMCYTVDECKRVAEGELELVKAQRNSLSFEMIADLHNEILDKVSILHPNSGDAINILITGIKRTYDKPGESLGEGGVTDTIDGWRITG